MIFFSVSQRAQKCKLDKNRKYIVTFHTWLKIDWKIILIYGCTWTVFPAQAHLKMILSFFLCQSMLTRWCDFSMIHTWLIELFDPSWYFSLSVINIFTRRNPHLKSLAKEGKVLTAFSRLLLLVVFIVPIVFLVSGTWIPCSDHQLDSDSLSWCTDCKAHDVGWCAIPCSSFQNLNSTGNEALTIFNQVNLFTSNTIPFFLCLPLPDRPKFLAFFLKK